jgi:hypothetical protein
MKILSKILIVFLLTLLSCSSPEQKIVRSFNDQAFLQSSKIKVKNVEIYDTVYFNDVSEKVYNIQSEINKLEMDILRMNNFRDSVLELDFSKITHDSLMKKGFHRKMVYDRKLDFAIRREGYYYSLYNIPVDSISAYYAKIITDKDTFNIVVTANTYEVLCPVFIFEH